MKRSSYLFFLSCVCVFFFDAQVLNLPPLVVQSETDLSGYFILSPVKVGKHGAGSDRQDVILDGKGGFVYLRNYTDRKNSGGLRPISTGEFAIFLENKFVLLNSQLREY